MSKANDPIGYTAELNAKRDAILAGCRISPAARARIMGQAPLWQPVEKVHRIVVDIPAHTRTVATTDYTVKPEPKPKRRSPMKRRYIREEHAPILDAVADAYNVTIYALLSPLQNRDVAYPRFAAMALIRKLGWSTAQIGKAFRRDHTTAMHALNRADWLLANDPEWADRYHAAERALGEARQQLPASVPQ